MLRRQWPEHADRLCLEWALTLTAKGLWLQAADIIWSLPTERERAAQWFLAAEATGGHLAIRVLVKSAILLPDTLLAYGPEPSVDPACKQNYRVVAAYVG